MPVRTLLVNMPFASATHPSLALGLLQATLHRHALECDCAYLNVQFADQLGVEAYTLLSESLPTSSLVGEWVFADVLFPGASSRERYEADLLDRHFKSSFGAAERLVVNKARELARPFLEKVLATLEVSDYHVVGFTSSYHQNIPALCLAKLIKEAHPQTHIVFGGANCEAEMGLALLRIFPFIDFVCIGEGDQSFVALVQALNAGHTPTAVGNIIGRSAAPEDARVAMTPHRVPLDSLPLPEYDDYLAELRMTSMRFTPMVPVEFSRGCWWGAKHHCTFCGLNGSSMRYASKSPGRAIAEIDALASLYGTQFLCVDNIFDLSYLSSVFPTLSQGHRRYSLFLETKANLRKEQIRVLAAAGVRRLQPGIESLSSHVLQLMRKGTTMLQNVQTLKWCKELGVGVSWNLLTGFPGERGGDYEQTLRLIPSLTHLEPPGAAGAIRIDRFSPFFTTPEAFGLSRLRPADAYSFVYPLPPQLLEQIAYYFQCDYEEEPASVAFAHRLSAAVDEWRHSVGCTWLTHEHTNGHVLVRDGRTTREALIRLKGVTADVLLACDGVRSRDALAQELFERRGASSSEVEDAFQCLEAMRLILGEGNKVLALTVPVAPSPPRRRRAG